MSDPITGMTTIEEDPISGDFFLIFPDEIAEAVGMNDWEWINWDLQPDGTVLITRVNGDDAKDEGDHF